MLVKEEVKEVQIDVSAGKARNEVGDSGDREMTEEERQVITKFKENDKKIEAILIEVIDNIDALAQRVKNIDKGISEFRKAQQQAHAKADKTRAKIEESNTKIKDITKKIGTPTKVCCYVVAIVVILICGYVIYSVFK